MRRLAFVITLLAQLAGCSKILGLSDVTLGGSGDDPAAMVDAAPPDAPTCTASSMFCGSDSAVYMCSSDGIDGTKVQDCEHGCAAGVCNACAPEMTFCNGNDLSTCDSNGNIADSTLCMGHGCQMDRCNTCTPNEQYCSIGSAVTCNADGTPGTSMACGANGCTGGVCNACTPNTTSCQGDTLVVCNAGGTVTSATNCALGCSTSGSSHCLSLVPSYSAGVPTGVDAFDLDVNDTATIDISSCTSTPNTVTLTIGATVTSLVGSPRIAVVTQSGATSICVVKYHNITIRAGKVLTIKNSSSVGQVLALEAEDTMNIQGTIAFRNSAIGSAKGVNTTAIAISSSRHIAPGGGGGGNARAGGQGGSCTAPACGSLTVSGGTGGAALSLSKLFAGSKGGDVFVAGTSTQVGFGGLGGGGLQLIALQSITVGTTGRIDVNGLGGTGVSGGPVGGSADPAGGGGAGGALVIETPTLTISQGAIVTANGGGGAGGCFSCANIAFPPSPPFYICSHINGQPGQLSATRATGGACTNGGNGGFAANGIFNPSPHGQNSDSGATVAGGGGGGGDGFIVLRTRDAARRMIVSGSVISPTPTLGNVTTN